jgi:hypothetical protein
MASGFTPPIWGMNGTAHHANLQSGDLEHRSFFNLSANEAVAFDRAGILGSSPVIFF